MFLNFKKLPLVVTLERYEVWVILINVYGLFFAEFHIIDSVLDDTYEQVLYYNQRFLSRF